MVVAQSLFVSLCTIHCDWCWRIGHKEAQCWLKQEYMRSNPPQDELQRDFREWTNTSEARARENNQEKGNHNRDQAGSPNEDGQRTLKDFGIKRQRVEFVGDVQEKMMILRLPDWIEQLLCFAFKEVQECYDGLGGIAKFVNESF